MWLKRIYILFIVVFVDIFVFLPCLYAIDLKAVEVSPAPDYLLCTDTDDLKQLTDGVTLDRYMWTKKDCVGWNSPGLAKVLLDVTDNDQAGPISGTISLHVGKGLNAGVEVPQRIDVFTKIYNQYYHVKTVDVDVNSYADNQSHWIDVDLDSVEQSLLLLIRPGIRFFFLDEIKWEEKATSLREHQLIGNDISDCEQYTISSLVSNEEAVLDDVLNGWISAFGNEGCRMWVVENPQEKLEMFPLVLSIVNSPVAVELVGGKYEYENICLGILNVSDGLRSCSLEILNPELKDQAEIFSVGTVSTVTGEIVYDPLLPLDGNMIPVKSREATYVWIKIPLSAFSSSSVNFNIDLMEGVEKISQIKVQGKIFDVNIGDSQLPSTNVWAYMTDEPIFSENSDRVISDLVSHKCNIFSIHPKSIPQPRLDLKALNFSAHALSNELVKYKNKGRLINLFLNWKEDGSLDWLDPFNIATKNIQKTAIRNWLGQIKPFIESHGISSKEWALHVIDEVRGDRLPRMLELAKWIKEFDSSVQIFLNPTGSATFPTSVSDLMDFVPYVDFWQPHLSLVELSPDRTKFFRELTKPFWIYSGVTYPAKAASPLKCYRGLAWKAIKFGAEGLGFWSYSNSLDSSVWNDYDADEGDYAVVYESRDNLVGPIGSRRWEAFLDGIEDYQLLSSVISGSINVAPEIKASISTLVNDVFVEDEISYDKICSVRRILYNGIVSPITPPGKLRIK